MQDSCRAAAAQLLRSSGPPMQQRCSAPKPTPPPKTHAKEEEEELPVRSHTASPASLSPRRGLLTSSRARPSSEPTSRPVDSPGRGVGRRYSACTAPSRSLSHVSTAATAEHAWRREWSRSDGSLSNGSLSTGSCVNTNRFCLLLQGQGRAGGPPTSCRAATNTRSLLRWRGEKREGKCWGRRCATCDSVDLRPCVREGLGGAGGWGCPHLAAGPPCPCSQTQGTQARRRQGPAATRSRSGPLWTCPAGGEPRHSRARGRTCAQALQHTHTLCQTPHPWPAQAARRSHGVPSPLIHMTRAPLP